MRRRTAAVIGTLTGIALMTAARLGTPTLADTVATAPLVPATGPNADHTGDPAITGTSTSASPHPQASTSNGAATPPPKTGATAPAPGTTTPASGGGLRSGTFTGSTVTHKYGSLQLTIITNNGRITDIRANYQTSSPVSKDINAEALPKLRSEALAIQSAQVHTVSGATYTSNAYRTCLQSALDKAKS